MAQESWSSAHLCTVVSKHDLSACLEVCTKLNLGSHPPLLAFLIRLGVSLANSLETQTQPNLRGANGATKNVSEAARKKDHAYYSTGNASNMKDGGRL